MAGPAALGRGWLLWACLLGCTAGCLDDGADRPHAEPVAVLPDGDTGGSTEAAGAAGAVGVADAILAGQDCLVIVLDALHARALSCYGGPAGSSPRIDALAQQSVRFSECWSQASWTLPSTTSLFTGLYQETHGVQFSVGVENLRLADQAVTLAELFQRAGYRTSSFSENVFAGPDYGLDQGFIHFESGRLGGTEMARAIAAELGGPSDQPRFVYAHFRRPHTPFDAPETARAPFVDPQYAGHASGSDEDISDHNAGRVAMNAQDLAHHRALYSANVLQADRDVGLVLDALEASRTLVVLLSDHGEAHGEHGSLGHNWASYQEYVHVPLVLSHPALPRGQVWDVPVMSVDLLPTLAQLFQLDVAGLPLHGSSLAPLLLAGEPPARDAVFSSSRVDGEGRQCLAVREGRHKLIVTVPAGTTELFDLQEDPGETRDLSSQQPELVKRLKSRLVNWRSGQRPSLVVASEQQLDAEALETLRRMGYIGDDDG